MEEKKESKSTELIEKANLAALRQEEANKKLEELLNRQEQMIVESKLGGTAEISAPTVEKTAEEKSIDSARELLKGTGYDEQLFPVKKE